MKALDALPLQPPSICVEFRREAQQAGNSNMVALTNIEQLNSLSTVCTGLPTSRMCTSIYRGRGARRSVAPTPHRSSVREKQLEPEAKLKQWARAEK